jgi:hypothetical protein
MLFPSVFDRKALVGGAGGTQGTGCFGAGQGQ